jgi:hypothetical protein
MTTVSRKQHRQTVASLSGAIFILATICLGLIFMELGALDPAPPILNAPAATTTDTYLHDEEVVILDADAGLETALPVESVLFEYVAVTHSCGPHFDGECLVVRSGPGSEYDVVSRVRNGVVLKVGGKVERDGTTWYKIVFDEWLRYPERITSDWYVAADYVAVLYDEGDRTTWENDYGTTSKKIIVDRSEQKLYAYDGDALFMETSISTGLALTPTPRGSFTIFKKTPSRYMQGPLPGLPSDQYYDLPGVPWNLYFTHDGAVIHGTYWHDSFGRPYSHGCVNVAPPEAKMLYTWADLGTTVVVRD